MTHPFIWREPVYGMINEALISETFMPEECFFSLILPAYNEEKRLPDCLDKVSAFVSTFEKTIEVLLIENGSSDRTFEMGRKFAQDHPWFKVYHLDKSGKGNAVRFGMMEAHGRYRMFADVDFAMPIEGIYKFIPPALTDADLAIASRKTAGAVSHNERFIRKIFSRGFNLIVQILAAPGIHDTQCGFKCFTAEAAERIFAVQQIDGWAFDAELLFIARHFGYSIVEVPIEVFYDENSKINVFRDPLNMLLDLLKIRKNYREGKYNSH